MNTLADRDSEGFIENLQRLTKEMLIEKKSTGMTGITSTIGLKMT